MILEGDSINFRQNKFKVTLARPYLQIPTTLQHNVHTICPSPCWEKSSWAVFLPKHNRKKLLHIMQCLQGCRSKFYLTKIINTKIKECQKLPTFTKHCDFKLYVRLKKIMRRCSTLFSPEKNANQNCNEGTSLVVQGIRIHPTKQGTQTQSLVWEDYTCQGAKPVCHNSWSLCT